MSRSRYVGLALVLVAATAGIYAWVTSGWTVNRVDHLVREEVGPGATREEVEAWLDGKGLKHYYSTDTETNSVGGRKVRAMAGLRAEDLSGEVSCSIYPANVHPLLSGSISIDFYFGKDGRLAGYFILPTVDFL